MKQFAVGFLINPVSGGGRGVEVHEHLPEIMGSFGYQPDDWIAVLTTREQFVNQVDSLLESCGKLIAVGGDGTMAAVLGRCVAEGARRAEVGLIPLGTGNDLARVLGIYANYRDRGLLNTVRKLIMAGSRRLDLWDANGLPMAAYLSTGIDAAVADQWNRDRSEGRIPFHSALMNKLWYAPIFLRLREHRLPSEARLRLVESGGALQRWELGGQRSLIVGNIGSYAGGACPLGRSHAADGLLEVAAVPTLVKFIASVALTRSRRVAPWLARWLLHPIRAREVEIFVPAGEAVQVDGEDRTAELSGGWIRIRHAGQVRLLFLPQ